MAVAMLGPVGALGAAAGGLVLPERVAGRVLWMESAMRDLIRKIQFGDPVRGWEGDPSLGVYWHPTAQLWELHRLEHDGVMRLVCRSKPGTVFDERLIDDLLSWDQRRGRRDLHADILADDERREKAIDDEHSEWVREEFGPRLHHAVLDDGGWGRRWTWGG